MTWLICISVQCLCGCLCTGAYLFSVCVVVCVQEPICSVFVWLFVYKSLSVQCLCGCLCTGAYLFSVCVVVCVQEPICSVFV